MATDDPKKLLEEMYQKRGYILDIHKIMAAADLDWVKAYDPFLEYSYTQERTLDRKTKELLQTVVLSALMTDVEHIKAHIQVAIKEGATPQEVLEALECVLAPMGLLGFRRGVLAWASAVGVEPIEIDQP